MLPHFVHVGTQLPILYLRLTAGFIWPIVEYFLLEPSGGDGKVRCAVSATYIYKDMAAARRGDRAMQVIPCLSQMLQSTRFNVWIAAQDPPIPREVKNLTRGRVEQVVTRVHGQVSLLAWEALGF
jgi:hypothetical protein